MIKNRETVSGLDRAGGRVSVVSIRGSAEAGIVGAWGGSWFCHVVFLILCLLPRRRSAMAPLLGLGSGDSAVRGSAAPLRGERETHHPHRTDAASPLDAIKKGTPPEVAAGPSRRRQRVRTSATRQRDSPAATPSGSRTKSFSVRRLIECPRSPRNSGQRWCEGVPPRLTRAAGTPTTQDPVILGRRVGSPKPNKNRATDRWPCGTR